MTLQSITWAVTCNRFVAFMDIMGFRKLISRSTHEHVLETLTQFRISLTPLEDDAKSKMKGLPPPNTAFGSSFVQPLIFSDSILLVSNDDSLEAARFLFFNVQWVLNSAISLGIPLKGAVSYGEQTADFDLSLHFGKPLIDAYELQNNLLLYAVVLHHTMEHYLISKKVISAFEAVCLSRYPTPFKNCTSNHYLVKYDDRTYDSIPTLYNTVSGPQRCYVDNTMTFANWLKTREKDNKDSPK